jgi:hypothetical protein
MQMKTRTRNPERAIRVVLWLVVLGLVAAAGPAAAAQDVDVQGAWDAQRYILADGTEHRVAGRIFFTGNDWTVLFFVMDGTDAKRGSGEGGSFSTSGDQLVFTHRYPLSAGDAMPGLAASELRMVARGPDDDAPQEPCTVSRDGDRLRLDFPSGNVMTFTRSAGAKQSRLVLGRNAQPRALTITASALLAEEFLRQLQQDRDREEHRHQVRNRHQAVQRVGDAPDEL